MGPQCLPAWHSASGGGLGGFDHPVIPLEPHSNKVVGLIPGQFSLGSPATSKLVLKTDGWTDDWWSFLHLLYSNFKKPLSKYCTAMHVRILLPPLYRENLTDCYPHLDMDWVHIVSSYNKGCRCNRQLGLQTGQHEGRHAADWETQWPQCQCRLAHFQQGRGYSWIWTEIENGRKKNKQKWLVAVHKWKKMASGRSAASTQKHIFIWEPSLACNWSGLEGGWGEKC